MKKKFLLGILIILVITLGFTGCQRITQEDVDRQLSRWWVIYYKMMEDGMSSQVNDLVVEVQKTLGNEFGSYMEQWDDLNLKDKYHLTKRRNKLMEEALVKLRGVGALKEIEGKYTLEEAYGSLEEANKAIGEGGD